MEDSFTQDNVGEQLKLWDKLHDQQYNLFHTTISRNAQLEARNEELERELNVWKTALKEAENDKKRLTRSVSLLQRNIDDNLLILCLIDGDGNIFHPELLALGNPGGRQAAMMLTKGIMDHVQSTDDDSLAGRAHVWLTIYCNLNGLAEAFLRNGICTLEQYSGFITGFNQSSPLFSVVDVGSAKEAADSKLKECLRVFTRFPQIIKVYFGGGHDNGYASTLNLLQTEGLLHKVILLRGYKQIAYELRNLDIQDIEIQGIFMTHKMQANSHRRPTAVTYGAGYATPMQIQDFDRFRSKQITPPSTTFDSPRSPSPMKSSNHIKQDQYLDPSQPLHKQRPPPCNFYYLSECRQGGDCHYSHDYIIPPEDLVELRRNAKKWPCPMANKGVCVFGNDCVMGHVCPRGSKCPFQKQGKCKYTAKNMHPPLSSSPRLPRSLYPAIDANGAFEDYPSLFHSPTNYSEAESVQNLLLPNSKT